MKASENGHFDVAKTLNEAGVNVDEVGHFCTIIKCTLYCLVQQVYKYLYSVHA